MVEQPASFESSQHKEIKEARRFTNFAHRRWCRFLADMVAKFAGVSEAPTTGPFKTYTVRDAGAARDWDLGCAANTAGLYAVVSTSKYYRRVSGERPIVPLEEVWRSVTLLYVSV